VARTARPSPKATSTDWPEAPCDDLAAEVARQLALRLRVALDGRSLRAAKALTGVDHTTIAAVLNGTTWADLATIARLEAGLDADLWPGRPRSAQR
jgi:hypothetical protein